MTSDPSQVDGEDPTADNGQHLKNREDELAELWSENEALKMENQALQAAYETQSKEYSASQHVREQLSEINAHLENRIADLEAGIAQDEADLEIAVREMDFQMEALEDRAIKAEEALKKERETLANQALKAADEEFEKIVQRSGESLISEQQAAQQAAELARKEEEAASLKERVSDLEAALQASVARADRAEALNTPAYPAATPLRGHSPAISSDSDVSGVSSGMKPGNLFANSSTSGRSPTSVTSKDPSSQIPAVQTSVGKADDVTDKTQSPRTVMSALFEQRRQRHRERAAQAASRMAERANFLAQATPSRNRGDDLLGQAVAVAAKVAAQNGEEGIGYAAELAKPRVVGTASFQTPEPMRPYSEQSLELLKMELMKRGIKDFSDSEGKTGLIARLRGSAQSTSPVTPLQNA